MIPTVQQNHILDLVENYEENLIIDAGPGTGKTRTLRLIDEAIRARYAVLYLAFNKRIVEEAKAPDDDGSQKFNETTEIRTINGAGHRVWGETASGRLTVDTLKTHNIFRTLVVTLSREEQNEAWTDYQLIRTSVGKAKALGYIPNGVKSRVPSLIAPDIFFNDLEEKPSTLAQTLIDDILARSIQLSYAGNIDYDDQLYMPVMFGGSFPQIPLVLIDEAQDLNPVNHKMLEHYVNRGARLIAVGDPWQSIYAFRGAVQEGMEQIKERFNCEVADLSISFRCPSEIVKKAQWRNAKLTWSREGGEVAGLNSLHVDDIPDDAAIICRNNAPLFSLALKLLSNRRGVTITGTDIGKKIVKIMEKLGPQEMKRDQLLDQIELWRQEKLAVQSTTANDTADCMRVFATFGKTLSEATGYAEFLFKQSGTITLTTGHKAKGLEWDKIYHLDPFLIRVDKEEQEKNLSYVVTTRSKDRLHEIESKDIVT
jgi:hypothetical protein